MIVELAEEADLDEILAWLRQEERDSGYSFIINENAIKDYFDRDDLHVIRLEGKAVAF